MKRRERTERSSRNKNPVYTYPRNLSRFMAPSTDKKDRSSRKRRSSRWSNAPSQVGASQSKDPKQQKSSKLETNSQSSQKKLQNNSDYERTPRKEEFIEHREGNREIVKREVRAATNDPASFNSNQDEKATLSHSPHVITVHVSETPNTVPPLCLKKGDSLPSASRVTEVDKPSGDTTVAVPGSNVPERLEHATPAETGQKKFTITKAPQEDLSDKDKTSREEYYPNSTEVNVDTAVVTPSESYSEETCTKLRQLYSSSRNKQQGQTTKTRSRVVVMPQLIEYYDKLEAQQGKCSEAFMLKLKERLYCIVD